MQYYIDCMCHAGYNCIRLLFMCRTTGNFQVTVLEYSGSFHTLSCNDVDQLLVNSRLEECTISIDCSLQKMLEVDVSASTTRSTRDLGKTRLWYVVGIAW